MHEACWFFDYLDGRRKKGVYNFPSQNPADAAWAQPKHGLLRAGILCRDGNRVEKIAADVSHEDFCNFEWVMDRMAVSNTERLAGLTLVTRDERITYFIDGKTVREKRDNSEDNLFHFGG